MHNKVDDYLKKLLMENDSWFSFHRDLFINDLLRRYFQASIIQFVLCSVSQDQNAPKTLIMCFQKYLTVLKCLQIILYN